MDGVLDMSVTRSGFRSRSTQTITSLLWHIRQPREAGYWNSHWLTAGELDGSITCKTGRLRYKTIVRNRSLVTCHATVFAGKGRRLHDRLGMHQLTCCTCVIQFGIHLCPMYRKKKHKKVFLQWCPKKTCLFVPYTLHYLMLLHHRQIREKGIGFQLFSP